MSKSCRRFGRWKRQIDKSTDRETGVFDFPVMFSFHTFLVNNAYNILLILYPICIEWSQDFCEVQTYYSLIPRSKLISRRSLPISAYIDKNVEFDLPISVFESSKIKINLDWYFRELMKSVTLCTLCFFEEPSNILRWNIKVYFLLLESHK
jgi:hypothetical protein